MTDTGAAASGPSSGHRLIAAEQRGLRIAVGCRTLALGAAATWWITAGLAYGLDLSLWAIGILLGMTVFGVATVLLIGTRFDRWWLKYTIYAVDILAVCAVFALVPLRTDADIPQIIAFRVYGIYFLFPLIAMACLTLSWRLVLWSGFVAVIGWWAAFLFVVGDMDRRLNWSDFPDQAGRADYEAIFLSMDFVGQGNRIIESGVLFMAATILALAVARARNVFFAQLRAETEREQERQARERIELTFGRYVPEAIAARLIDDDAALAPQMRSGVVLVMDIAGFTRFAEGRPPSEVIERLNGFLAGAADIVSERNGVVIQFTGDGLLATFNTPLEIELPERAAFDAAGVLVDFARSGGFAIRIGLAAGPVAAGSIGSAARQAFTVYGDTVNRAARLEALGKDLRAPIVLVEACATALPDRNAIAAAGAHRLQGLSDPVEVWTSDAQAKR